MEATVASTCEASGFHGKVERFVLEDPFRGFKQLDLSAMARDLIGAAEVLLSATGGTTLMRLMVTKLAAEANRLGVPVRTFGLIDQRAKALRELEPLVVGEIFWID